MLRDELLDMVLSDSVEDLWATHCQRMEAFGFDRLIYGNTRFRSGNSLGTMEDALILSNQPQAYIDRYFGENHYKNSPILRWCRENKGACSWSWIEEERAAGRLSPEEEQVVASNHEFGIVAGYTICFKTASSRSFAGIALTARAGLSQSEVDQIWDENATELMLRNHLLHLKMSNLPTGDLSRLTQRQREVLEWAADGKTIADIARLIGRKPATVEKHLRLAREALNAETTAQAVLKASIQNQIFRL